VIVSFDRSDTKLRSTAESASADRKIQDRRVLVARVGKRGESDAFVDPAARRNYAANASMRLEQRLREEQP
jgi:hypothetical protein